MSGLDDPDAIVAAVDLLVKPDGGAFELTGVDPAAKTVSLRLVLDGVECVDCVMPRSYLEELSLTLIRDQIPDVERVEIEDPRE
jgi:hypothetical protein